MQTVRKFSVDVLVCGGGVAGSAAGIAAARMGVRTLLVESRESLGGICTNGYVSGIAGAVEGICEEWVDRLAAKGAALKRPHLPVIEPEMGKMELEQMLLQAGCRILYGVQVVDAVVAVASALDLRTCAEGVETQAQLDYLRQIRCDLAQGYLFAKPLPADELEDLLASDPRW